MTIGDLARESDVKIVTIRYYEQAGLMPVPLRTEGNYRTYGQEQLQRLLFIRRLRDLGFTLEQVRDLLRLASDKSQSCGEVDRITRAHLATVEEKIRSLKTLASELGRLSRRCAGGGQVAECAIIEALSTRDKTKASPRPS
jgi:DNA-binding transcriptional MerR regulator